MIILILIFLIIAIVGGALIGFMGVKFMMFILEWRIRNSLKKLIEGKYKNRTEIEGKTFEVDKFHVRDDEGNMQIISLKGGLNKEDAPKKENRDREIDSGLGKNSRSTRKKKPDFRRRIARRFA